MSRRKQRDAAIRAAVLGTARSFGPDAHPDDVHDACGGAFLDVVGCEFSERDLEAFELAWKEARDGE